MKDIAIWAGVECTINRVNETYFDQCQKNGHDNRLEDLDRFATLGIKQLRQPFLWERVCKNSPKHFNWDWCDERIKKLQELQIEPIAGLLHHGSGPAFTSLIDPEFPQLFATYAAQFAKRYPWIRYYTPINEPLTTARFSGLYGYWYPHLQSDNSFVRILLNQIKATTLAMAAILRVRSDAVLVQTEDLGKISGTPQLQDQVNFENIRRWLSFDLLSGKVMREHPLYDYLVRSGLAPKDLEWQVANACPPDILGINHYLQSNRFLDERLDLYPARLHGGNGRQNYADVAAVETGRATPIPLAQIIQEAWDRYSVPIALTEVHLNGPRESQMRWFHDAWQTANRVKASGVNICAVTAWSLLGSFDWNSLCTQAGNFYEPGVFDVRAPQPRVTALGHMMHSLAAKQTFSHPVLVQKGWWHGPERMQFGSSGARISPKGTGRPILITGATGTLGSAFARICECRGIAYRLLNRNDMDIADPLAVTRAIEAFKPWAVINTAGYVRVDLAEQEPERCFRENAEGPAVLAQICADRKLAFLCFSSDMVFDGKSSSPYLESSRAAPINIYGRSKAECETLVLACHEKALVIRTSSFIGPWDQSNFVTNLLGALIQGHSVKVADDLTISPTYIPDLVNASLDLLIDGEKGLLHLVNQGSLTWAELGHQVSSRLTKQSRGCIIPTPASALNYQAKRPAFSALGTEKVNILPPIECALDRYFYELESPMLRGVA